MATRRSRSRSAFTEYRAFKRDVKTGIEMTVVAVLLLGAIVGAIVLLLGAIAALVFKSVILLWPLLLAGGAVTFVVLGGWWLAREFRNRDWPQQAERLSTEGKLRPFGKDWWLDPADGEYGPFKNKAEAVALARQKGLLETTKPT